MPLEYTPGCVIEWLTIEKPVMMTSSAMLRWPAMPTPPPIMQRLPMTVLPEMPVQAAIRSVRADAHVVADHDEVVELDALLDHGVVDGAAVDGGVGADLDVGADAHRCRPAAP